VQSIDRRFGSQAHQGPLRIEERELKVRYGKGKVIFVEHTNDLFAEGVEDEWVWRIFEHMLQWPENRYVMQTKNPAVALGRMYGHRPPNWILGVTVESDVTHVGNTPHPRARMSVCRKMAERGEPVFITIEPVLTFTDGFAKAIAEARPTWVNIGADSKNTPGLPQPTRAEVLGLIAELVGLCVEVRLKKNLERLKEKS
jgi:protein gp37